MLKPSGGFLKKVFSSPGKMVGKVAGGVGKAIGAVTPGPPPFARKKKPMPAQAMTRSSVGATSKGVFGKALSRE